MTVQNDIAVRGFRTLVENLGVGGALRFIQQYERGGGNFTTERDMTTRHEDMYGTDGR